VRLATVRTPSGTRAVRVDGGALFDLGVDDVGALLADPDWSSKAAAAETPFDSGSDSPQYAPVILAPSKIVCVGLNYRNHIQEMGRDLPEYPTLFAKFADCLLGANDDIQRPPETKEFDWEAELAVIIGRRVRRASGTAAEEAIAGFAVLNDITCRDWQFRTREWLQGKAWDSSTPLGPHLVTPDVLPGGVRPTLDVRLTIEGETMQEDNTGDLLFDPVALVEYVSTMVRLNPGDIIATGTPGGVGHARTPARNLVGGEKVVTEIEGLGTLENLIVNEGAA
jgi:2-keto-4-pentenoate hydratase/2-oxohepta-3-ene-1,7-dioic acid hydratase in catechol pathway